MNSIFHDSERCELFGLTVFNFFGLRIPSTNLNFNVVLQEKCSKNCVYDRAEKYISSSNVMFTISHFLYYKLYEIENCIGLKIAEPKLGFATTS